MPHDDTKPKKPHPKPNGHPVSAEQIPPAPAPTPAPTPTPTPKEPRKPNE